MENQAEPVLVQVMATLHVTAEASDDEYVPGLSKHKPKLRDPLCSFATVVPAGSSIPTEKLDASKNVHKMQEQTRTSVVPRTTNGKETSKETSSKETNKETKETAATGESTGSKNEATKEGVKNSTEVHNKEGGKESGKESLKEAGKNGNSVVTSTTLVTSAGPTGPAMMTPVMCPGPTMPPAAPTASFPVALQDGDVKQFLAETVRWQQHQLAQQHQLQQQTFEMLRTSAHASLMGFGLMKDLSTQLGKQIKESNDCLRQAGASFVKMTDAVMNGLNRREDRRDGRDGRDARDDRTRHWHHSHRRRSPSRHNHKRGHHSSSRSVSRDADRRTDRVSTEQPLVKRGRGRPRKGDERRPTDAERTMERNVPPRNGPTTRSRRGTEAAETEDVGDDLVEVPLHKGDSTDASEA